MKKETVFRAGLDGYACYRIPALATLADGTLAAFCESRTGDSDWAPMALQMRLRKPDGEWGAPVDIARNDRGPAHNPVPFLSGGALHLLYGLDYKRIFHIVSFDGGRTFGAPEEWTEIFETYRDRVDWRAIAVGPGGACALSTGRILAPIWVGWGTSPGGHAPAMAGAIYSDDGGATWKPGALVPYTLEDMSEAQIAPVSGGALISLRNADPSRRRAFSFTADGESWTEPALCGKIVEVTCQGSLLRAGDALVATGPAPLGFDPMRRPPRERLSLWRSDDDGASWSDELVIEEGPSGYSALANAPDGGLYCLYERWTDIREMDLVLAVISRDEIEALYSRGTES